MKTINAESDLAQPRIIEEHWDITYHHSAGTTGSYFFETLENEGRLVGKKCDDCQRILMPPRSFCDRCFVETNAWVKLGTTGNLEAFTIVYQGFQGLPDPPYAIGYVVIEGASTAILNFIRGVDLSTGRDALAELYVGAPMRAVFAERRQGRMADFWFEPA